MNWLKLDPLGGISGDMFLATLVDLGAPLEKIQLQLEKLDLGQAFKIETERDTPRGFSGLRLKVKILQQEDWIAPEELESPQATPKKHAHIRRVFHKVSDPHVHSHDQHTHSHDGHSHGGHRHTHHHKDDHSHIHHRTFADIKKIISQSDLAPRIKARSTEVFRVLALAEGTVHGKPAEEVHFHEVGAVDSIVDIVGSCCALEFLNIDHIVSTAIGIAQGQVNCAHGQLPLPAPATQYLLLGCPVVHQPETKELCTPTGAALLKALAQFELPEMSLVPVAIGTGLSHRIPRKAPPFLRGTILRTQAQEQKTCAWKEEQLLRVSCDIDDMNPEYIPLLQETLLKLGLLDAHFVPLHMKKGRPGFEVRVLCQIQQRDLVMETLFKYSTTFGCRVEHIQRFALPRVMEKIETPWGIVNVKRQEGSDFNKTHIEFEDIATICRKENLPWAMVLNTVNKIISEKV